MKQMSMSFDKMINPIITLSPNNQRRETFQKHSSFFAKNKDDFGQKPIDMDYIEKVDQASIQLFALMISTYCSPLLKNKNNN